MNVTHLIFLIGGSPFIKKDITFGSQNVVVLELSDMPEDEQNSITSSEKIGKSNSDRIVLLNDIFQGNGFFDNFYSEAHHGFPFRQTGRLIGLAEVDGPLVRVLFPSKLFQQNVSLEDYFPGCGIRFWCASIKKTSLKFQWLFFINFKDWLVLDD